MLLDASECVTTLFKSRVEKIVDKFGIGELAWLQATFHRLTIGLAEWQIDDKVFEFGLFLVQDLLDVVECCSSEVYCDVVFHIEEFDPRCSGDVEWFRHKFLFLNRLKYVLF